MCGIAGHNENKKCEKLIEKNIFCQRHIVIVNDIILF